MKVSGKLQICPFSCTHETIPNIPLKVVGIVEAEVVEGMPNPDAEAKKE